MRLDVFCFGLMFLPPRCPTPNFVSLLSLSFRFLVVRGSSRFGRPKNSVQRVVQCLCQCRCLPSSAPRVDAVQYCWALMMKRAASASTGRDGTRRLFTPDKRNGRRWANVGGSSTRTSCCVSPHACKYCFAEHSLIPATNDASLNDVPAVKTGAPVQKTSNTVQCCGHGWSRTQKSRQCGVAYEKSTRLVVCSLAVDRIFCTHFRPCGGYLPSTDLTHW